MSASSGPAYAAPRQQVDEARTFDATIVAQGYVHNALGARVCGSGTLIDLSDMDMAHAPRPQVGHTYHFENAWIFEGNPGQLFFLISNSPRFRYWEILGCPSSPAPAAPQIVVNFSVDQANLMFGQCTNIRWDVDNVRAVYLDGQGVVGHDSRQVCPSSTTTYNLRAQTNGGDINRSVTVNLQIPPPQIVFSADQTSIMLGDCTTLRWALAYVQGMSLDGSAISNPGSRQVCPRTTTTYALNATTASGPLSRSVTVSVIPPTITPTPTPTRTATPTPTPTTSPLPFESTPNLQCYVHPGGDGGTSGRILILLQGLESNSLHQEALWSSLISRVSNLYSGIIYFSYSGLPDTYSKEDTRLSIYRHHVPLLHDLIERCHLDPRWRSFDLVGHSQGGVIAWEYIGLYGLASSQAGWVRHVITLDSPVNGSLNLYWLNFDQGYIVDWALPILRGLWPRDAFMGISGQEMATDKSLREDHKENNRIIAQLDFGHQDA